MVKDFVRNLFKKNFSGNGSIGLYLLFFVLLITELLSYRYSTYPANSFFNLDQMYWWAMGCLGCRWILYKIHAAGVMHMVYSLIGGLVMIVAIGALLNFLFFQSSFLAYGWSDVAYFKGLFSPYGLKLNDWATISICLLPFPLITAVFFKNQPALFWLSILTFVFAALAVFISFSRGAYLALFVFVLAFLMLVFSFKLLTIKRFLLPAFGGFALLLMFGLMMSRPILTTLSMNKTVSQQRSTQGRLELFSSSICKLTGHALTGVGGNNFALGFNPCMIYKEDAGYSRYANNLFLQILIEKGWLGFGAYALLFLSTFFLLLRDITILKSAGDRVIAALLLSGLIAYCFRELFFSSFFNCIPVLAIVGFYIVCNQYRLSCIPPSYTILRLRLGFIFCFVVLGCWLIKERLHYRDAAIKMKLAREAYDELQPDRAFLNLEAAMVCRPDIVPYLSAAGYWSGQLETPLLSFYSDSIHLDPAKSRTSIAYFQKALMLNKDDGGILFNLACLFALDSSFNFSEAQTYFERALHIEPNNSEFLIGYGLLAEQTGRNQLAYAQYYKAMRVDPEIIDSRFFKDLKRRDSLADTLLAYTTNQLAYVVRSSTILAARLARLLLAKGDTAPAKILLEQVIEQMPDLNRPYYYLGLIAQAQGSDQIALDYFKKSLFLNPDDYLPYLAMGHYYFSHFKEDPKYKQSIKLYYLKALDLLRKKPSQSFAKSSLIYKQQNGLTDDMILNKLVSYIRSDIDEPTIRLRIQ